MKGAWKLESWTGQVVRRVSEEGGGSGKEEKVARARGTGRDHGSGGWAHWQQGRTVVWLDAVLFLVLLSFPSLSNLFLFCSEKIGVQKL